MAPAIKLPERLHGDLAADLGVLLSGAKALVAHQVPLVESVHSLPALPIQLKELFLVLLRRPAHFAGLLMARRSDPSRGSSPS